MTGEQRYNAVSISLFGVVTDQTVHSLVALAFLGPRPEGYDIDHRNTDKRDNRLSNLEYVTKSENKKREHANRVRAHGARP